MLIFVLEGSYIFAMRKVRFIEGLSITGYIEFSPVTELTYRVIALVRCTKVHSGGWSILENGHELNLQILCVETFYCTDRECGSPALIGNVGSVDPISINPAVCPAAIRRLPLTKSFQVEFIPNANGIAGTDPHC